MKALTTFAFLTVFVVGLAANAASADLMMRRDRQSFLFYFGDPCPCKVEMCQPECPKPCDPCA